MKKPADELLRRVFVPIEYQTSFGSAFRTHDGTPYMRDGHTQVIRRARPKVKGKAARRADKRARRVARTSAAQKAA